MGSPARLSSRIRFGPFELDAAGGELRKAGILIKLRPQAVQVLRMLAERAGQMVTREEIRDRLWSDNTFVDFDRSINFCINQIRGALADDPEKPRYVETLPRRGYRFIASVTLEVPREPAATVGAVSTSGPRIVADKSTTGNSEGSGIVVLPSRPVEVPKRPWTREHPVAIAAALILTSLVAGFWSHKWLLLSKGPDLQKIRITKLTDSGAVVDVAISPDGGYVVYAQSDGEKQSLRLRQVATSSDVQILPPEDGSFHGLTFSPDSQFIYFVRTDPNDPFFKYLYAIPILGGFTKKLITDVDSPVSFSPDGRRFAYERCISAQNQIDVRIANADGTSDKVLTSIPNASCFLYQPGMSWSPDGRTLAIPLLHYGKPEPWVLHVMSVADGSVRTLYSSPSGLGRPAWLAEENALLVPHYDPAARRSQLWIISYPGGKARRLTNDLNDYDAALDIMRHGDTVAAIAGTAMANVWAFPNADPARGRQLTSGNLLMSDPAEARDGRILSIGGNGVIWAVNADGGRRTIFSQVQNAGWPTTCADYIVVTSFGAGVVTLLRLDADGSNPVKLASGSLWSPTCSRDGRFVFYVTVNSPQKIWRVPMDGGTPVQIAEVLGDGIAGDISVSPKGQFIAYPFNHYTGPARPGYEVAIIPVGGGAPVKTFDVPVSSGTRWSPRGKGIQYAVTQNGTTNLWEQPLAGSEPRQVTNFTSGRIFDFNWSLDGKRLLLTRGSVSSDVVLLSNLR